MGHWLEWEMRVSDTSQSNCVKVVKSSHYPKVVYNLYKARDMIDNHNSNRMHPISMEETWMMAEWPNCVFCFLLAVIMVNAKKCSNILPTKGENG